MENIKHILENNNYLSDLKTPSYIFDIELLHKRIDFIRKNIDNDINLCFAMKSNPFLVANIKDKVDRLEVCSDGEYKICEYCKVDAEKIIISGVNKTYESMKKINRYSLGKGIYTIESKKHLKILSDYAKELGIKLNVIVRLTSGNQFGVDKDTVIEIITIIKEQNLLEFKGIHYYSGTQKKMKKIEKEITMLDEFASLIKDRFEYNYIELEYGPGLSVNYFCKAENNCNDDLDAEDCLNLLKLNDCLKNIQHYNKITLEFGRFLSYDCGYYFSKVMDVKHDNYLIIDGGIHQINYYGQVMGMKKPYLYLLKNDGDLYKLEDKECTYKYTICGSLCTSNDVLVREISSVEIEVDDVLIFKNVGAYSVTEGMALFLSRELPQIYMCDKDKKLKTIRKEIEVPSIYID